MENGANYCIKSRRGQAIIIIIFLEKVGNQFCCRFMRPGLARYYYYYIYQYNSNSTYLVKYNDSVTFACP